MDLDCVALERDRKRARANKSASVLVRQAQSKRLRRKPMDDGPYCTLNCEYLPKSMCHFFPIYEEMIFPSLNQHELAQCHHIQSVNMSCVYACMLVVQWTRNEVFCFTEFIRKSRKCVYVSVLHQQQYYSILFFRFYSRLYILMCVRFFLLPSPLSLYGVAAFLMKSSELMYTRAWARTQFIYFNNGFNSHLFKY